MNATDNKAPPEQHGRGGGRPFVKMHGLGNHFVIVDARTRPFVPTVSDVIRICDVHCGVGADQLLIIEPGDQTAEPDASTAFMRILNLDGHEAGACGNATRCVAWLLLEEAGCDTLILETQSGALRCSREGHQQVSVDMGPISSDWQLMPLKEACDTLHVPVGNGVLKDPLALSIGNPHLVFFTRSLADLDLCKLAPAIQNDPLFPEQINVGAVEILSDSHIRLSVYERPGILTKACGSGACVAAMAMRLRGHSMQCRFRVDMSGGTIDVELRKDGSALMTGPVEYCFRGTLAFATGEPF